jgi:3-carboxy-cis,cis-muconate cycloisomerase
LTSDQALFAGIYARGPVAAQLSDRAWLQAMLDVEAALARACAAEGLIPEAAATQIAEVCYADRFDMGELGAAAAESATPVVGLVKALRAAVPESARDHVHLGATSQDISDTALMLIAHRGGGRPWPPRAGRPTPLRGSPTSTGPRR